MEQSDSTAAPIDPQYYMTCPECKLSILKTDYIPHYWERHRDIVYLKYRGRKERVLIARDHNDRLFHCICEKFSHMDAAQMHLHVSIDCNPPDPDPLPLQQEKPIADESSIGSDAEQEVQEEEGDAEEQNKPIVQEQQVNTTAFMDMTIMADDEQIKWEQQSQHFESKVASISKQHEKQTHHMGQQFENLIHYFDYIMQDQEQHSHDMQTRFRLLLHSLAGKKSVLLTIPSHQRLDGTREASARSNWIRLLVQNHMGNKLDKEEVASAVQQGGEIRKGDILVQDLSDMIDYALALIFEPGTK